MANVNAMCIDDYPIQTLAFKRSWQMPYAKQIYMKSMSCQKDDKLSC